MDGSPYGQLSNTIVALITHPRRKKNHSDGITSVNMKAVGQAGTKKSTTIHIQPVFIKWLCAKCASHDCRYCYRWSSIADRSLVIVGIIDWGVSCSLGKRCGSRFFALHHLLIDMKERANHGTGQRAKAGRKAGRQVLTDCLWDSLETTAGN